MWFRMTDIYSEIHKLLFLRQIAGGKKTVERIQQCSKIFSDYERVLYFENTNLKLCFANDYTTAVHNTPQNTVLYSFID